MVSCPRFVGRAMSDARAALPASFPESGTRGAARRCGGAVSARRSPVDANETGRPRRGADPAGGAEHPIEWNALPMRRRSARGLPCVVAARSSTAAPVARRPAVRGRHSRGGPSSAQCRACTDGVAPSPRRHGRRIARRRGSRRAAGAPRCAIAPVPIGSDARSASDGRRCRRPRLLASPRPANDPVMPATAPYEGMPTPARYVAMMATILGILLSVLDATIVNLALPGIAQNLHASPTHAIWVVTSYQLAILTLLLPLALLGDRVGYRRVFLGGVAIFTVASLGCALAPNLAVLVVARACQGVGAAGIMSVNAALVRAIYPSRLLGRGMAINSLVVATGSVAGPSIAALILSVATLAVALRSSTCRSASIALFVGLRSLPANVSASGARPVAACVRRGDERADVRPRRSSAPRRWARRAAPPRSAGRPAPLLIAAGALVGVFYVRRQLRRAVPMLPIDLLRIPVFALSMGASDRGVRGADARVRRAAVPAARRVPALAHRGRPADHGVAARRRDHGADRRPADRPLSRRTARRHRHGGHGDGADRARVVAGPSDGPRRSRGAWSSAASASASSSRRTTTRS